MMQTRRNTMKNHPTEDLKIDELIGKAEYKQHPFGTSWQPFDEATFKELVADVDRRGLDKEIILYQRMVLDGWHRYLACLATGVKPKFREFKGTDLEAAELVHASGIRRHVNADQRYASFVMLCDACPDFKQKYERLKAEGEQRQMEGKPLDTGAQRVDVVGAKAKAAGVSKTTAQKVEKVKKVQPEAVAKIAAGETTANKELKKLNKPQSTSKNASPKAERPTISEVIQILCRGLTKTEEADKIRQRRTSSTSS